MKKFFYSDPLAAAWMAVHFDMKFAPISPELLQPYFIVTLKPDWMVQTKNFWGGCFYIHPDSLHLLKARAGDVCWEEGHQDDIDCGLPFDWVDPVNHGPIIMRDGKPFFWPEREV